MYLNAEQLPDATLLRGFDICIVGAGAAGLAMAKRLIGSSSTVLLLASGYASDRGRPEATRQNIYKGTVGDFLKRVDPIFLDRSRLHMYGGTTNHFGFWSRPLDAIDFKSRPGYRAASWPLDSAELTPYYHDAHHFGRFGPFNYEDMAFWERVLYARSFAPQPGDSLQGAIMHAQYDESLHDFQVQFGAELRAASNITVLFNAHLLTIESSADKNHVTGLVCAAVEDGKAGRGFRVEAAAYALAMGGIETVRALKLSGDLGNNASDHLGRGFMLHPLVTSAASVRFARPIETEIRNFFRDQQVRLQPPTAPDGDYIHMSAPLVNPEYLLDYCVFNAWGVLVPKAETLIAEQIGNFRLILRFDPAHDSAVVNINWEQVPNEDSRITLNPTITDPVFGQPVTHLDWRLTDTDKRTAVRALEICEAYLREHGAIDFQLLTDLSGGADHWSFPPDEGALATGDHHMGTMRMSSRGEDGIVNSDSRLHRVDNLYIAGCGVFPTGGFANPTLTIVALALRLADHLQGAKT
jgi:choline dehydrogenase-like flavoprotein